MKKMLVCFALLGLNFSCAHRSTDRPADYVSSHSSHKKAYPKYVGPKVEKHHYEKASGALAPFLAADSSLNKLVKKSVAYIVFPSIGKGAVGIGGAFGKGTVYARGPKGFHQVGRAELSQISAGLQLGGQTYSQIVFFENQAAFNNYKKGSFELSANASVVALKEGGSANAIFREGVATVILGEEGLMGELSIAGQKISYEADKL